MTRKTLGTGLIVSEENTLIKNMLKLKDSQGHLLVGKNGAKNKREKTRKAIKSCTKGCRRSTRSTWLEPHVKRKRLDRERSVGMRRGVPLRLTALLRPASQNWATVTSLGQLQEGRSRRWWTWCCMVWTERMWQPFVKRCGSNKLCGIQINLLSDVKPG